MNTYQEKKEEDKMANNKSPSVISCKKKKFSTQAYIKWL